MEPIPYLSGEGTAQARETLICLHCSASSGRQWAALAASLGDQLNVLTPDLIGYADRAPWPAHAKVSLDDEADALAALIESQPGGVHLLGHSYGGAVALQIAMRWPERVKSLTVYEPVRFALLLRDPEMAPLAYEVIRLARAVQAAATTTPDAAAVRFVDYWSGQGTWDRLGAARQRPLARSMTKVGAEFGAVIDDRAGPAAYRRLTMPVRLLGGDRSPAPVLRILDRLQAMLPQAERISLAGLGHMGPVEAPERIALVLPAAVRDAGDESGAGRGHPVRRPGKDMPDLPASGGAVPRPDGRMRTLLTAALAVSALAASPIGREAPGPTTAGAARVSQLALASGGAPVDAFQRRRDPTLPDPRQALRPLRDEPAPAALATF
jgi:pimeloyl-ACP methyl ester carboxylesterase